MVHVHTCMLTAVCCFLLLAASEAFQPQRPLASSGVIFSRAGVFQEINFRRTRTHLLATNVGDVKEKIAASNEDDDERPNTGSKIAMETPTPSTIVVQGMDPVVTSFLATEAAAVAQKNENWYDSSLLWKGVVAILCALWASNFAVGKLIMAEPGVDSSLYCLSRFSVAALCLAPFAVTSIRRVGMDMEVLKGAAACGSWVAFGYLGQILGLLTTTASRSCVICSLHCVFVALVAELARSSKSPTGSAAAMFDTKRLGPAVVAVIGVAIVELQGAGGAPNIGDALSFAQPIGFGMGYLQLEELMRRRPDMAMTVSAIKLVVVALTSLFIFELGPVISDLATGSTAMLTGGLATDWALRIPDFGAILASPVALGGILYTGLVTTALALWVESIAFARVPATDASIILTTEPLFAAALGAATLGETFGVSDYFGATLIVGACVLAALMDNPGDEECVVEEDPSCEPPRKWPFWGF